MSQLSTLGHVFLTPAEVMARYRWGRTKGYEVMRSRRDDFPCALGGRYRLDSLPVWEDRQLGLSSGEQLGVSSGELADSDTSMFH